MRERRRANEEIWHKGLEAVEMVSWEHYEEHSWWKMTWIYRSCRALDRAYAGLPTCHHLHI